MPVYRNEKATLALAFALAAIRYWFSVYPRVRREVRRWRVRAQAIPDPRLRRLAPATQRQEQGNLEGAAAFAVLAPRSERARVVRAVIAFQAIYDYVDTLSEQPSADPAENGRELHRALASALEPGGGDRDYYVHGLDKDDGGYLRELIEVCRSAFGELPSHASLAGPTQSAVKRIVAFQGLAHGGDDDNLGDRVDGGGPSDRAGGADGADGGDRTDDGDGGGDDGARNQGGGDQDPWRAFADWADAQVPPGSGLRWWETAAGAASSLLVFALIATAAQARVESEDIAAIEEAYFPWIGALHLLLDSLVDRADDVQAGTYSLVDHYASPAELAERLRAISAGALRASRALARGAQHELILVAMASFYLTQPAASSPSGTPARAAILATLGERAVPTMWLFRARRGRSARRRASL